MVVAQAGTIKGMIGNTQTAVENEMQKLKSVIDGEFNRVNVITNSANTHAVGQVSTLDKLRQDWQDPSIALRAECSKLIADGKVELEKDQQNVEAFGQTLATEAQTVQQRIAVIKDGLTKMSSQ